MFLLGGVAACASAGSAPPGLTDASGGTSDVVTAPLTSAVYTAQQADRGQRVFSTVCSACHGRNEFSGPIFAVTWMADPIGHLFEHIRTSMPQDQPGSLSNEEYAAVLAYFLRVNGREAGDVELPADADLLSMIRW